MDPTPTNHNEGLNIENNTINTHILAVYDIIFIIPEISNRSLI